MAEVKELFGRTPNASIRSAARELNISRMSVWRSLKEQKFHLYKLRLPHQLEPEDNATRLEFCRSQLEEIDDDEEFISRLVFSDEANFHLQPEVNRHNFRYWSIERPQFTMEEPLHSPHVGVWVAIGLKGIVGPYFFNTSVKATNYGQMLDDYAWPQLVGLYGEADDIPLEQVIFMQDGAPPHFGGLRWLAEHFEGRWMGRGTRRYPSPFPWPPRPPDLAVMDFFLWGYIKSRVYSSTTPYPNLESLRQAITREMRAVPQDMIEGAMAAYGHRLQRCVEKEGGHVENY